MKTNIIVASLLCLGLSGPSFAGDCSDSASRSQASVRLDHFTWLQQVKGRSSTSMLVAVLKVENLSGHEIVVPGIDVFGRTHASFGGTAKVWTKALGEEDWEEGVGATGSSRSTERVVVVKANGRSEVIFQWPLSYLVDYPAETLFRVGFVDSLGRCHSSEAFRLHDGKIKLTYQVLR